MRWPTRWRAAWPRAVDLSDRLYPYLGDEADEPEVVSHMRLAARLINANLGVRLISIVFGDFDTHANQVEMHNQMMDEMNAALHAFYGTLSPIYEDQTVVVGTSEFGRRVHENGSGGTDHGTSNSLWVAGSRVNGGFFGSQPSMAGLRRWTNTTPTVDVRHFYGNIVERWLGADSAEIIGRDYSDLGFLRTPGIALGLGPRTRPGAGHLTQEHPGRGGAALPRLLPATSRRRRPRLLGRGAPLGTHPPPDLRRVRGVTGVPQPLRLAVEPSVHRPGLPQRAGEGPRRRGPDLLEWPARSRTDPGAR